MYRFIMSLVLVLPVSVFSALNYLQEDITNDTTWTIQDSPVYIYGNITVKNGATLTIMSGVEVYFMLVEGDGGFREGSELYIADGKLIAEGTQLLPVIFTSGGDIRSDGDWGCIAVEDDSVVNLNHCVIEYAKAGLIFWNLSSMSEMASSVNYCRIYHSSEVGILFYNSSPTINFNSIKNNRYGIQTQGLSSPTVNYNDICSNYSYNFRNLSGLNQDATSNWWGTTNINEIEANIYDYYDNHNYGVVDYTPFLESSYFNEGGIGDKSLGWLRSIFVP